MRLAFTIIEILLVISALGVLLGAVASIAVMLAQMEKRRAVQTEQQRTVRNWTQLINDDFRSAIQDSGQSDQAAGGETIRHFGVTGTAEQLRIDIANYTDRTSESSELRTIYYEFDPITGLIRTERDYAASSSVAATVQNAPQIVAGRFQYYDGGTWLDHWASLERKSIPSAIEITFYTLPYYEADRWRSGEPDIIEPYASRRVVQIPSAFQGYESYHRAQPPPPADPSPVPHFDPPPVFDPPPSPFHSLFGDN